LVTFAPSAQAWEKVAVCPTSFPAVGAISSAVSIAASDTIISVCPGIYYDNVTVNTPHIKIIGQGKNGAVELYCIYASGSGFAFEADGDEVENIEIAGCQWGVLVDGTSGAKNVVIRQNIFVYDYDGVELYRTKGGTVQANQFANDTYAVVDSGSTSSDIGSNTVIGVCPSPSPQCNVFGISLESASKASVKSNHVTQVNQGVAVFLGTNGSTITENKVTSCYESFYVDQAGNNTFTKNEADASAVGFLATSTTGQDSSNGKINVFENNKAQGNQFDDLLDQSSGAEPGGVANKWHKNTCGGTGSNPTSLCTD
jgi:parallel beta-helix repeat protein